jgi:diguanylate cyclase (GGDEF)-like protein/PAS domain S-box-containing protein
MHPEDRPLAAKMWWQARSQQGEICEAEVRYKQGGSWYKCRTCYLDLLHQPDFEVVLIGIEQLGEAEQVYHPLAASAEKENALARWHAPFWIAQYMDGLGTIIRTEGQVEEIFGCLAEQLVGRNAMDVLHPDDHEAALGMWVDILNHPGETRAIRQRVLRPDNSTLWIETSITNRLNEAAPYGGMMVGISQDVSDRMREEFELRESRQEFRSLAEEVPAAVFRAKANGEITYANARWYSLITGMPGPVSGLTGLCNGDDRDLLLRLLKELEATPASAGQLEFTSADGVRRFSLRYRGVETSTSGNALLGVLEDITDTAALRFSSEHDSLTGLLNRPGLAPRLAELLESGGAVVAFVDLDSFKHVNDSHGHDAGDLVLAELGRRLAEVGEVVSGRWGGDEFVIVAPASRNQDVVAQRLRGRIEELLVEPIYVAGMHWLPKATIGIAVGAEGESPSDLLREADLAMYGRKRSRGQ